jgi:DNA-binding transcriptional LysR family regulator
MAEIELRHLAALVAIAEEGSFGRAATRLGFTQSTVSQQIANLERAIGGAVLDRPGGPKPVRLTPLGAVVLEHGRDLLARAETMTDAIDRFKAGDGRIDLGTFQSISNTILPVIVRRLRDEHPGCDIRLYEEEADPPRVEGLDLVFFDGRVDGAVEHRKLLDDPYVLVAQRGAFRAGPVSLTRLDGVPIVAYPPICDQPRVEQEMVRHGLRPRIVFRTAGNEAVLSMVRAGLGVAVLPRLSVHGVDLRSDPTLRLHQLRPALTPREVFLLWPAGRTHSPLAVRAIRIAVEVAGRIAKRLSG